MSSSTFPCLLSNSQRLPASQSSQWVVLLHGLFATRRSMRKLERRLTQAGYKTINWNYPTFLRTSEGHVQRLRPLIENLQRDPQVTAIHFVTHSMGGILVRYALHGRPAGKVKRIVMLAPPNQGSYLTRLSLGPLAWLLPTIVDLSESSDSLPNRLVPSRQFEIGVIAALRDVVVRVSATHLLHQQAHCTIDSNHFQLPFHEQAIAHALHFLATGRFVSLPNTIPLLAPLQRSSEATCSRAAA